MINKINKNLPVVFSTIVIFLWFIIDLIRNGQNIENYYFLIVKFNYLIIPVFIGLQFFIWKNDNSITTQKKIFLVVVFLASICLIFIEINPLNIEPLNNFITFGTMFYALIIFLFIQVIIIFVKFLFKTLTVKK